MRKRLIILISILWSCVLYAQENKLSFEQGGIFPNTGALNTDKRRIHTNLLLGKGYFKINEGYSVMSMFMYDNDGNFVGIGDYSITPDRYVIWHTKNNVRFSLYNTKDIESPNLPSEPIIADSYVGDDFLSVYGQNKGIEYLDAKKTIVLAPGDDPNFADANLFRIPASVICNNGDIIVGCEAMSDVSTHLYYVIAISRDNGRTFISKKVDVPVNNLLYDKQHDRIFCFNQKSSFCSENHGESWVQYSELKLKVPQGFDYISMSPTNGIQLKNGILAMPMRAIRRDRDNEGKWKNSVEKETNFIIYSMDFGHSWEQSMTIATDVLMDEACLVEYKPNKIMLNARGGTEHYWNATRNGRRVFVSNTSLLKSRKQWKVKGWAVHKQSDGKIWDPLCNASIAKTVIDGKVIALFCNPDIPDEYTPRRNLCLRWSKDFILWNKVGVLTEPDVKIWGYSNILVGNGKVLIVYEDEDMGISIKDVTDRLKTKINQK